MSGWRKFGVALYCSTTLAATVVVGFALFIGATPSKINLFDKNRDIRNWVFIAAAVSLAYIALSAFTMFCILTTAKKSDLKCVSIDPVMDNLQQKSKIADDSNPLLHSNSSIKPTVSSQQLDDKGSTWDTKKDTNQINNGCGSINIRYNQTDSLRSDVLDHIQLPQLQIDSPNSKLMDRSYSNEEIYTGIYSKLEEEFNSKLKKMEERDQKAKEQKLKQSTEVQKMIQEALNRSNLQYS